MKIFAVKSDSYPQDKVLAWLIYYVRSKRFYIELPENADPWETPLLLSSFAERGEKTVNAYWSKVWVQQRIVPTDRQNLGQILKDNGLKEYDEYALLMLDDGRCAQDDYYLESVTPDELPAEIRQRFTRKISDVIPLPNHELLVFFIDKTTQKCNIDDILKTRRAFAPVYRDNNIFNSVKVLPGGYGVGWSENMELSDTELYSIGTDIPLSMDAFLSFLKNRTITVSEAASALNCSRQNIENLVKHGKLHPVKSSLKTTLFAKQEIEQRCI